MKADYWSYIVSYVNEFGVTTKGSEKPVNF